MGHNTIASDFSGTHSVKGMLSSKSMEQRNSAHRQRSVKPLLDVTATALICGHHLCSS